MYAAAVANECLKEVAEALGTEVHLPVVTAADVAWQSKVLDRLLLGRRVTRASYHELFTAYDDYFRGRLSRGDFSVPSFRTVSHLIPKHSLAGADLAGSSVVDQLLDGWGLTLRDQADLRHALETLVISVYQEVGLRTRAFVEQCAGDEPQ